MRSAAGERARRCAAASVSRGRTVPGFSGRRSGRRPHGGSRPPRTETGVGGWGRVAGHHRRRRPAVLTSRSAPSAGTGRGSAAPEHKNHQDNDDDENDRPESDIHERLLSTESDAEPRCGGSLLRPGFYPYEWVQTSRRSSFARPGPRLGHRAIFCGGSPGCPPAPRWKSAGLRRVSRTLSSRPGGERSVGERD